MNNGVGSRRSLVALLACSSLALPAYAHAQSQPVVELKDPGFFDGVTPKAERSRALFHEAGKVIQSPRCLSCHPKGDTPTQGDDAHPHYPPVTRGKEDDGVVGMKCATCHQDRNLRLARVPGAPRWHLAPRSQSWAGKSLRAICEQIKDPSRNGGLTMEQLIEHFSQSTLVGWAWSPGSGRTPAPGTQNLLAALISSWAATGAECPREGN